MVLTSLNLEKKGLILKPVFYHEKEGSLGLKKSVFYHKKGGSFWTEKSVFYREKCIILSCKVSVLPQKRGSFSNWRTRMCTTFCSEWESRGCNLTYFANCTLFWRMISMAILILLLYGSNLYIDNKTVTEFSSISDCSSCKHGNGCNVNAAVTRNSIVHQMAWPATETLLNNILSTQHLIFVLLSLYAFILKHN